MSLTRGEAGRVVPLVAAQLGRGSVLADGRTHRLRVRYLERGGQLEVYLDEMSDPVLVAHRLMLHEVLGAEPLLTLTLALALTLALTLALPLPLTLTRP